MELHHLQAFVLAVELGSISAAARRLGKHQSQVSQWISHLEADLGLALFNRSGNHSQLSEAGQQLLERAQLLVDQSQQLTDAALALSRGQPTSLRVGVEHFVPWPCLAPAWAHAATQLPHLKLISRQGERDSLLQQLAQGQLDAILLCEESSLHYPEYGYQRLGSFAEVLAVAAQHPLALGDEPISCERLSLYPELILSQHEDESIAGLYSPQWLAFGSLSGLLQCLEQGMGYGFVPLPCITTELAQGRLRCLTSQVEPRPILRRVELLWRPGLALQPWGATLLQSLSQHHHFQS